jgi:hypothetical protein
MLEPELFQIFAERLNHLGIRYMITGSVASMIYGEPRLTHDIDFVVEIEMDQAEEIVEAFPLDEFYCPPVEVIKVEAGRQVRGHFNIIHHETGFKADIYLMGEDDLHAWALSRRRSIRVKNGDDFWVAPPEYVILRKLQFYQEGGSEKHLRDIRGMIEISGGELDRQEIEERAVAMGLQRAWKQVSAESLS